MMEFKGINMKPRNEDADRLEEARREYAKQELQEIQIKRAVNEFVQQMKRITGKHIKNMKIHIEVEENPDRKGQSK